MLYSYLFQFCYLEHLYSLRAGHVNRLMSWVRLGYKLLCTSSLFLVDY